MISYLQLLHPKLSSTRKGVSAEFKDSLRIVSTGDNEFHTVIDSPFAKKRPGGKLGQFATCVRESVDAIVRQLRGKADYDPILNSFHRFRGIVSFLQ